MTTSHAVRVVDASPPPVAGDAGEGNELRGRLAVPQPRLPCHDPFKTAVRQVNEPPVRVRRGSMTV